MSAFTIVLDPATARFYENVAQAAGVFPPGGKAAEIFGVKAIDDEPLLRYLKLC